MIVLRDDDYIFPYNNPSEIPLLDINMQAQAVVAPVMVWGEIARKRLMPGTYNFYTHDYRFEAVWKNPQQVVDSGCRAVVEPNFSIGNSMSLPVGIYNIYRKRFLAKFWQVNGIRVFVDLFVGDKFKELNFLGVPKGWAAYAMRVKKDNLDYILEYHAMAEEWAGKKDILFLAIGAGRELKHELCKHFPVVYVEQRPLNDFKWLNGRRQLNFLEAANG